MFPSLKRKEIRSFATTGMHLEGINLSETSQTEESKCLMSFICVTQKNSHSQKIEFSKRVENGLPWTGGGGNGKLFNGYRFSILQDEKVLKLIAQQCEYT